MWIEVGFIIIPILFHSLVGFYIYFSGKPNPFRYNYPHNWMYTLQRISGAIIFVFLVYHLATTVVPKIWYGNTQFAAAPYLIDIITKSSKPGMDASFMQSVLSLLHFIFLAVYGGSVFPGDF